MTDPDSGDNLDGDTPSQPNEDSKQSEEGSAEEWLPEFADGDEEAFNRLVQRELPRLRRPIDEKLGPDLRRRIDPSDVLQQAALDVYQLRDKFEDRGLPAFRAWLKKVTMNNLNRLIERELAQKRDPRKEKRRAREAGKSKSLDPLGHLQASISSPSAGVHREEALDLLEQCLDMLGDDDRELLRWVDEDGLEYEECARRLSVNIDAARRRHSRAIARLRKFADAVRSGGHGN
ncbi:sigma-70 family RNA polymerase sigma factor [Planctomycetota bacterium]|nr:sigma-70 family RNA polymerase sigma factor [Planctomycetota bacterium]